MDHFFPPDLVFREDDLFFYDVLGGGGDRHASFPNRSAFRPYTNIPAMVSAENASDRGGTATRQSRNVKRRMVELARRAWEEKMRAAVPERERCHRHMMNERLRRERQKQSYSDLHSLLPAGIKNDKNSIIKGAVKRIQELQLYKRELKKQIYKLNDTNLINVTDRTKTIRVKLADPTSGIYSIEEVLRCLKNMGASLKTIQASFSPQELSAVLDIQTQIVGADVEKAVEKTLQEAEWKLLFVPGAQ